jgi:hypothetical protein
MGIDEGEKMVTEKKGKMIKIKRIHKEKRRRMK